VDAVIEDAMQTPDDVRRVEVVERGRARWYRVVHGDNVLELWPFRVSPVSTRTVRQGIEEIWNENRGYRWKRAHRHVSGSSAGPRRP
jgi:hypothetical protein